MADRHLYPKDGATDTENPVMQFISHVCTFVTVTQWVHTTMSWLYNRNNIQCMLQQQHVQYFFKHEHFDIIHLKIHI